MKKMLLFSFLTLSLSGYAQHSSEEEVVKTVVNQFFQCLESKDTVLFKRITVPNGQVWTLRDKQGEKITTTRFLEDDLNSLSTLPPVQEEGISFDIQVHKDIAVAWVPYQFQVEGQFSHCGVDVFTLMKLAGNWKIMNVSYTIEKEGCENLGPKEE